MKQWRIPDHIREAILTEEDILGYLPQALLEICTFHITTAENVPFSAMTINPELIVITEDAIASRNVLKIVYHELVHAAQSIKMGHMAFLDLALNQWSQAGFNYDRFKCLSLESEATRLTKKFMEMGYKKHV